MAATRALSLPAAAALLVVVACAAPVRQPEAAPPAATQAAAPTVTRASTPPPTPPPAAVGPSPTPARSAASPGAGVVDLSIGTDTGNQTAFVPDSATVPSGSLVRLTFDNVSTTPHNLTFGEPVGARTAGMIDSGMSETIEFTAPPPGTYEWVCTLHPWMVGTLTVTD